MTIRASIMQPYFFPYIGYWQLIKSCDVFVLYDDIQYTKKGWINRNRWLMNGEPSIFTLPLKAGDSSSDIIDRWIADEFDRLKFIRKMGELYRKAPYVDDVLPMIEGIVNYNQNNLFYFLKNSIEEVMKYMGIRTRILVSSELGVSRELKGQDRVLATCKSVGACSYINPIGGLDLYDRNIFEQEGIKLNFLRPKNIPYRQFGETFVPFLSVIDVLMFNSSEALDQRLSEWELV